ncbi:MAG: prefoldin subunit alpha [Candidatus Nanoarchaeia archaeon]
MNEDEKKLLRWLVEQEIKKFESEEEDIRPIVPQFLAIEETMTDEKEMQRKYVAYQMMEQQIKQVHEQLEKFEQQVAEIKHVEEQLEEVKKIKKDTEALIPVANGIFIKGRVVKTDEVIVNVGADVAVKKKVEDTQALLRSQIKEIENFKIQVKAQLDILTRQFEDMQQELRSMVE